MGDFVFIQSHISLDQTQTFTRLCKWVILQHLLQLLHYFCHTPFVLLVFKPHCCCFSRIEKKSSETEFVKENFHNSFFPGIAQHLPKPRY
jgi:hypothetical protein